METIATPYELLAMADGPKLPARTPDAKTPQKIQVFTDTNHEQSRKYPDKLFLDPRINKPFAVNKEILILKAN